MCAAMATTPLVVDQTICRVSAVYGSAPPGMVTPPARSTTRLPWTWMQQAAPTSPNCSKLAAKASWTGSKPDSTEPRMRVSITLLTYYARIAAPQQREHEDETSKVPATSANYT